MLGDAVLRRTVTRVAEGSSTSFEDSIAVERPLQLRVDGRELVVTLRTPGHDEDLALGFLASEGLVARAGDVASVTLTPADCTDAPDVADIVLAAGVPLDWARLERHFAATAACGLCGRAHLESLRAGLAPAPTGAPIPRADLLTLPDRLRERQAFFLATGSLHGAVWCDRALEPVLVREDVGRHNAVDKVCGALLTGSARPSGPGLLWVSGRAGAELVLKAARAGMPAMAAVGAPSSLAVDLAEAAGMTLIGFMREGRMNVYTGETRIGE